jgi:pilus assembly protein CpaE
VARVYVIDDDEQLLRMVGLMLERGGHSVKLISDPVLGLEQVKTEKPDLLVVDVMMPNMSGHEITRQLRQTEESERLPILVLTARSQEVDRVTALKSGATGYLSKPVTSQELIEKIESLLTKEPEPDGSAMAPPGMVIAFFGLRGGVGQTTLAVNLAAALRRASQQAVCLVDLSPSVGQAVIHLRLQVHSTWADLPRDGTIDLTTLKTRLISHPAGFHVLASPTLPQPPDAPSVEETAAVLELLRQEMRFTILDLPHTLSPAFMAGLNGSDIALHVITPDMISVQTAVQANRVLTAAGITFRQKSCILNQVTPESQLSRATVERGMNGKVAFEIGYDANQSRALSQGVPLVLTSAQSPLPVLVNRMADVIWQRVGSSNE